MQATPHSEPSPDAGRPETRRVAGDRVGRYVLRELLGEGGMGTVWVADDPLLAIPVALKVLTPEGLGRNGVERLLREARAAARLHHPAIVQVLDFGVTPEGEAYLALELLEGEPFSALPARGPVPAETVVALILPLLDALATAHERGIVHRDIKPDNLFLARDGRGRVQPKVLDFGIAKSTLGSSHRLTCAGAMIGTPAYMAPEQARGANDVDARADLWAVAVTMFELLTATMPFEGPTVPQLLSAILEREPPPLPGVDEALAAIVFRNLAKDPEGRHPDARAMGEALARWLVGRDVLEDCCGTSVRSAWLGERSVPPPPMRRALPSSLSAPTEDEVYASPVSHRTCAPSTITTPRPTPARVRPVAFGASLAALLVAIGAGIAWLPHGETGVTSAASARGSDLAAETLEHELPVALGAPTQTASIASLPVASARAALSAVPAPALPLSPPRGPSSRGARQPWFLR